MKPRVRKGEPLGMGGVLHPDKGFTFALSDPSWHSCGRTLAMRVKSVKGWHFMVGRDIMCGRELFGRRGIAWHTQGPGCVPQC